MENEKKLHQKGGAGTQVVKIVVLKASELAKPKVRDFAEKAMESCSVHLQAEAIASEPKAASEPMGMTI